MKTSGRIEYEVLGSVIRSAREEQRLSQRDLATKAHRPQSSIAKIELGNQGMNIIEFIDLAEALGLQPNALFDELLSRLRPTLPPVNREA